MTVLPNCETFYIHEYWDELPLIETGMLRSFYPPFEHGRASVNRVAAWARKAISQPNYRNILRHHIVKKSGARLDESLLRRSEVICEEIVAALDRRSS